MQVCRVGGCAEERTLVQMCRFGAPLNIQGVCTVQLEVKGETPLAVWS